MKKFFSGLITIVAFSSVYAQDSIQSCSFSVNMDIASRYVWRGLLYSDAVNLQPMATLSWTHFTLGTWASYAVGKSYAEVDFSASWANNGLNIGLNDYCTLQEPTVPSFQYFNFKKSTTPHAVESYASYQLQGHFPLKLLASSFIYGYDKDSTGNNYYSTYIELSYPVEIKSISLSFFAGGTLAKGLYANKAGIVNVGFSAKKEIVITDKYTLPLLFTLTANPEANYIYSTFIISL